MSKCSLKEEIVLTAPGDFICLQENKFITDSFLDFYMGEIFQNYLSKNDKKGVFIFSTMFGQNLFSPSCGE